MSSCYEIDLEALSPDVRSKIDSLQCVICFGVCREPVETSCGHLFGEYCIAQWASLSGNTFKCPICGIDCGWRKTMFQKRQILEILKTEPGIIDLVKEESKNESIAKNEFNLARNYVQQSNEEEAFKHFSIAANLGHIKAMYNVGLSIYNGEGIQRDYDKAMYWFRKSAEQGHAMSMNHMGVMFHLGKGVKQDYVNAMYWYRKAADLGHVEAMHNIGLMFYNGEGIQRNFIEAMYWYRKAAERGNKHSMCDLGAMFYRGYGVEPDCVEAIYWFRKSAEQGNERAQNYLNKIRKSFRNIAI